MEPLENWQDKERSFTVRDLRSVLLKVHPMQLPGETKERWASRLANEITLTLKDIQGEEVFQGHACSGDCWCDPEIEGVQPS